MKKKKNKILVYVIVAFCVIISGVGYAGVRLFSLRQHENLNSQIADNLKVSSVPEDVISTTPVLMEEKAEVYVYVHMCGSVQKPGIVKLLENSRVKDAVELAGGFTKEADETYVNLARMVKDGERIYIPSLSETEALSVANHIAGKGLENSSFEQEAASKEQLLININTATEAELTKLPGIGSSKAADIINYRNKVGRFGDISEIMNVSGIGTALFEKIKDFICV